MIERVTERLKALQPENFAVWKDRSVWQDFAVS
jgi:hypothetical protein